jgi:ATP-dependent exoDNAse (exonuclease V) alpha subunit
MNLRSVSSTESFLPLVMEKGALHLSIPLLKWSAWSRRSSDVCRAAISGPTPIRLLVSPPLRIAIEDRHTELSPAQLRVVDDIFVSREKIVGLDGIAGTGKTTTLAVIREGAEAEGYKVEGFAPTSRATQKLAEAGIETSTLQRHLARGEPPDTGEKRFYVLDESSLASTRQMHEFMERVDAGDRVLLVGDTRQHEAVEAGRPFAQLQEAGMRTVRLEEIVRQKDPELKQAVEQLAHGQVGAAIDSLDRQGPDTRSERVRGAHRGHCARVWQVAAKYAGGIAG